MSFEFDWVRILSVLNLLYFLLEFTEHSQSQSCLQAVAPFQLLTVFSAHLLC